MTRRLYVEPGDPRIRVVQPRIVKEEARDDHGRWSAGGGGAETKVSAKALNPGDTIRVAGLDSRTPTGDGTKYDDATHRVPMGKIPADGPVRTVSKVEPLPQIAPGNNNLMVHTQEGESFVMQTNMKVNRFDSSKALESAMVKIGTLRTS